MSQRTLFIHLSFPIDQPNQSSIQRQYSKFLSGFYHFTINQPIINDNSSYKENKKTFIDESIFNHVLSDPDFSQIAEVLTEDTLVLVISGKTGYLGILKDTMTRTRPIILPGEFTLKMVTACIQQQPSAPIRFTIKK